jgi:hypothetical protein
VNVLKSLRDKEKSALLRERERERAKETKARDSNERIYGLENPIAKQINSYRRKRKKFNQWLLKKISDHHHWDYEDTIYAGSEHVDADPQTVTRWLKRGLSSEGKYDTDTVDGVICVVFKSTHQSKVISENPAGPS